MERRISTAGFFCFKAVLPFSISVRSYSSLPTLQGRAAVESIGTTRIRYTQALWTQAIKQIFYLSIVRTIYQSLCCSINNAYIRSNGLSFGQSISRTIERSIYRIIECSRVSCFHIRLYETSRHLFSLPQSFISPHCFCLLHITFSFAFPLFPCFSPFLFSMLSCTYLCTRQ